MNDMHDDAYYWHIVKELVKQMPNDLKLGEEVRSLFWKVSRGERP